MTIERDIQAIKERYIVPGNHQQSDYFSALKEIVDRREAETDPKKRTLWQQGVDDLYLLVKDELLTNDGVPTKEVSFGTSGWRGMLGKDIFVKSIALVTAAILKLFREAESNQEIQDALGVLSFDEMQQKGCVVGFDNRFGGELLALSAVNVLVANGVKVYYAGEATTGILSASVLKTGAAFSINLTPSHNPMEYGGFKFNAADAGPAAPVLTDSITANARKFLQMDQPPFIAKDLNLQQPLNTLPGIVAEDALASWQDLIRKNVGLHGIDYDSLLKAFTEREDVAVCVDAVHGASRLYLERLCLQPPLSRFSLLRNTTDPTFGGIAPEPSSVNMVQVTNALQNRAEPLKLGAIIDPDGDRIRFTDGTTEISMNQFGAMAYHFLHEIKGKKGMVAKTVATSNLANALAEQLGEETFEPKVGFKEFKPVIGKALVFFEESDGISLIGHTPEKDAFIGLILALDMVLTTNKSLGEYLHEIESTFGFFYPDRDGVTVSQSGQELLNSLQRLEKYTAGIAVTVGEGVKEIKEVITIDGRKMIFTDDSWIMIRPSGTEPKVRFYVEARNLEETALLVKSAKSMLAEIGLLP